MGKRKRSNEGYRSKFEASIGASLRERGVDERYEAEVLHYMTPCLWHKYTPDWSLGNGIVIEAKGRLTAADRKKMIYVKDANPHLDIRFVFQRASNPIRKGSKTTYADWAEKNGFKWAEGDIPTQWIKEKPKKTTEKPAYNPVKRA